MLPLISIITPSHKTQWLERAYASLKSQTESNWEWILLLNSGLTDINDLSFKDDSRVVVVKSSLSNLPGVGALKKEATSFAKTPYVIEFDHDDELSADCVEWVLRFFQEDSQLGFVYSNAYRVHENGNPEIYGAAYGWTYVNDVFLSSKGPELVKVAVHPELLPQNVSRIWYAPDHVRAWKKSAYDAVGGHDSSLRICDDQDLMCKLFRAGYRFSYIPKVLYRYHIHGNNTWLQNAEEIQTLTLQLHDRHIQDMALLYWTSKKKICADLGGGINSPAGWTSVDVHDANITADLTKKWPFEDNSVGVFRAQDVVEHLPSIIHTMNEAYRCLTHGGLFLIEVPSTDGRGWAQDPSHVSFWNSNSVWYYTRAQTQAYIKHLGVNCKFQAVRVLNYYPTEWHQEHLIMYAKIHLAAIKDGPRLHGLIEI